MFTPAGAEGIWPPADELRLVLIGKTGSGKSASAKTILSWSHILSKISSRSMTKLIDFRISDYQVEEEAGWMKRRIVVVVDFPGFRDTHQSKEQVIKEVTNCVVLSAPGPHAFLLTVPLGRFTEEKNTAATMIAEVFGEVALRNHTMVLFTRGDYLEESIVKYLAGAPASLKSLIDRCGGRYHVLNNRATRDVKQVHQLIRKVEQVVDESGGFYTNIMYQVMLAAIQEKKAAIQKKEATYRVALAAIEHHGAHTCGSPPRGMGGALEGAGLEGVTTARVRAAAIALGVPQSWRSVVRRRRSRGGRMRRRRRRREDA
ncbi:hypothetical protein CRUP_018320 [Coryphaenoides rupestris]|nr:hypothetical protein CRUP_018320 [Coryphaenoides rupestris]